MTADDDPGRTALALNAHQARILDAWHRSAEAWDALRETIEAETGLRTWNPGVYGRPVYERFVAHYAPREPGALLALGLNPGKYGMCQSGIPFTDLATAKTALPALELDLEPPGLAPADLRPFIKGFRRERSCQSVYGLLENVYGTAAEGWRDVYVANPCHLLFLEPDGVNVTPADSRLSRRTDVRELRLRTIRDAIDAVEPRGILFLGQDVVRVAKSLAVEAVGEENVLVMDHPVARGPGRRGPKWWAEVFGERLRESGLSARTQG